MSTLIGWLEHVGLAAVFAWVLLEQVGLPLPSYPLLIIAGSWSVSGGAPALRIVAVAVFASLLADLGWYAAGNRLGSRVLRTMCRVSLEPDSCIADTEKVFTRFGTRALLFAKFVPGLGAVATAMSGVVGASLVGFVGWDLIGATVWAGSGVAIGALFHDAVDDVFSELGQLGRFGIVLVVAALGAFLALKAWRRHLFYRELRMARISVDELARLVASGATPMIVDARSAPNRARDGMIPGAVAFEALGGAAAPIEGEVIVYCACPNEASAARIAKQLIARGFTRVRPLEGGIHAWTDAGHTVLTL